MPFETAGSSSSTGGAGCAGESSGGEEGVKGLREWWSRFKAGGSRGVAQGSTSKGKEIAVPEKYHDTDARPVFAMPLSEAITYASITISTPGADGNFYVWGVVPTVVARCGRYLKENATEVEGTFRVSGSNKRMRAIQAIFDTPPKYGKYIDWSTIPHTTHDVATIFRRFLTQMPEPVIPDLFYKDFRETLRKQPFDEKIAVQTYTELIGRLPVPNKYLLLYVLDLLSVFEKKADKNLMTATNLAVIFQPGILSHPDHRMLPHEHALSQRVVEFLVAHVDDFSALLESRLKENPYRRGPSSRKLSKTTGGPSAASLSMSGSISAGSHSAPTAPAGMTSATGTAHPVRPPPLSRASRLSDTMAASESDDDFPSSVVVRVNPNHPTHHHSSVGSTIRSLGRSKSTSASSKNGPRALLGRASGDSSGGRSGGYLSGPATVDEIGRKVSSSSAASRIGEGDTPVAGIDSSNLSRRATAPSRRAVSATGGTTSTGSPANVGNVGNRRKERSKELEVPKAVAAV